jgi:hypothetical protein
MIKTGGYKWGWLWEWGQQQKKAWRREERGHLFVELVDAWMRQGCSAINSAGFTTGAVVAPISRAAHASLGAE